MHPSLIDSCFLILLVNETVLCPVCEDDLDQMKNDDQRKPPGEGRI